MVAPYADNLLPRGHLDPPPLIPLCFYAFEGWSWTIFVGAISLDKFVIRHHGLSNRLAGTWPCDAEVTSFTDEDRSSTDSWGLSCRIWCLDSSPVCDILASWEYSRVQLVADTLPLPRPAALAIG